MTNSFLPPQNWTELPFREVYELQYGKALPQRARSEGGSYSVMGSSGVVGSHTEFLVSGPVIIVGRKGAAGAVSYSPENCWPIDTTYFIKPPDGVGLKFAYYHLQALQLTRLEKSTAVPGLSRDDAYALQIALPPTQEQKRIVARIEELFSELDKGAENLAIARQQLKAYRHSLLRSAFEGKLSAGWREANRHILEGPQTYKHRVCADRETLNAQQVADCQLAIADWKAKAEIGPKPQKPPRLRPLSNAARSEELNGIWPTFELGDLLSVSSGQSLTSAEMHGGPCPVYGGNGIAGYHDEYVLTEPTLVIGRVGAKCGVTHITKEKSWVTDNALIVSPLTTFFEPKFFRDLLKYLNLNRLGSSTGQPVISGAKIYPELVFLPGFEEQKFIADRLEELQGAVDAVEAVLTDELQRCEALRQSVLNRAFCGRLVPQDPSDEPVSVLLERIEEQKEKSAKHNKHNKKREAA